MTLGPLDYTVIGFAGNNFDGSIAREIGKVVDAGIVRIVDIVFVTKDEGGKVDIVELDNIADTHFASFAPLIADRMGLLTPEDIARDRGRSADRHVGADHPLGEQVGREDQGSHPRRNGFLVAHSRIQPEALEMLNAELEAAGAIA